MGFSFLSKDITETLISSIPKHLSNIHKRIVMFNKIFNTLAQFGIGVIILYGILQMFEINQRSITAIILAIGVWHFAGWLLTIINK